MNSHDDEKNDDAALHSEEEQEEAAKKAIDEELSGQPDLDERLNQPVFTGTAGIETAQVVMSAFLIVVITLIAYSNILGSPSPDATAQFHHVDFEAIVNNPAAHAIATSPLASKINGVPVLSMLTIAVNWWMAPASPVIFYLTNILLHAFNGVLVYLLTRRLLRIGKNAPEDATRLSEPVAMLGGLVVALHPLATESVNLAIGRTPLLCAASALGAVLLMLRATDREDGIGVGALVGAGICFALSWACGVVALLIPAFMLIADWIANGACVKRRLAVHAAFWGIAIAFAVTGVTVSRLEVNPYDVMKTEAPAPPGVNALAFSRGLALSLNGSDLTVDHDLPPASGFIDLEEPGVNAVLAISTAAGLGLVALILIIARSPAGLGLAWFLLALIPIAFFVPPHTYFNERSLYFGLCGLALLAPAIVAKLLWKRQVAIIAGIATVAILLTMAAGTYSRNRLWQDEIALWEDAATKRPEAPEPYIRLGEIHYETAHTAYTEAQMFAQQNERAAASSRREDAQREFGFAQSYLQQAVEIKPEDAMLRNMLGVTLAYMNKREEAIAMLTEALRLDPSLEECTVQLASLYEYNPENPSNLEEKQIALDYFRRAERIGTLPPGSRITYAMTFARTGNVSEAARALAPLKPSDPQSPAAGALQQLTPMFERLQATEKQFREADTAAPGSAESVRAQIEYLLADGQTLQAFYLLDRFVRYNPDDFHAWLLMGLTRARVGESQKFIEELPNPPAVLENAEPAWLQLARRSGEAGRWDAARKYLEFAATQSDVYAQPLLKLSDLAIELKQFSVASAALTEITNKQPENPQPWLRLCDIAIQSNNLPQARRYLDEAERVGADPAAVAPLRAKAGETPEEEKRRTRTILE